MNPRAKQVYTGSIMVGPRFVKKHSRFDNSLHMFNNCMFENLYINLYIINKKNMKNKHSFFKIKFLEDISPFCGVTDTPVLDLL